MKQLSHRRRRQNSQAGYFLLVVLFMVALMMLAVTAGAPSVAQQVKRDREIEMIHRGAQYARAIKRFYRKYGRYPTSVEQLENTNNIRFLRRQYADPMAEDGKWKFLHPGDVKIGGANVGTPVSQMASGTQQPTGIASTNPSSSPLGSSPSGSSTGPRSTTTTTGGAKNSQFGGFIIGVASASDQTGIHAFNDTNKYSEWYFIYDPTTDRGNLITGPYSTKNFGNANPIPGATPAGQIGQPAGGFGQQGGFGRPSGGFGQPIGGSGPIGQPTPPPKQ
jgi:type II secretory pathway pseudopilin PulG